MRAYENYRPLDSLGRCQACTAVVGPEARPTEPRGSIAGIRPSGWHTVRYDDLIEKHYLYNRCHLIAYALTGQNDNERNLITGTHYLNIDGMLPFENRIAYYVATTKNHVLYRVRPVFRGNDLVASGVELRAESIEDGGKGICFHVYCYNEQPGIVIDHRTGESRREKA